MSDLEEIASPKNDSLTLVDDLLPKNKIPDIPTQLWKILIADDDIAVHQMTERVLGAYANNQIAFQFLHAHSAQEAKELISEHQDTALVLLDVVMESENAGFEVIQFIRDFLHNDIIQIVVSTGHPGHAPEQEIIAEYRINDYKSKVEFTAQKLYTTVTASLRAFSLALSLKQELIQRSRAEEALRVSEEKYRVSVENANDAILILFDGHIKFHNKKTEDLTELTSSELRNTPFLDLVDTPERRTVDDFCHLLIAEKSPKDNHTFKIITKSHEHRWVDLVGVPIIWEKQASLLCFIRDITHQYMMEEQIRQSQKLEAIGALAGGIAHDFNNILSSLIGYSELAVSELPVESSACKHIEKVLKASDRAVNLVKQILAFTNYDEQEKKPIQISSIIKEVTKLLSTHLSDGISIQQDIQAKDAMILGDATQIHQVLMNLCTNAFHAMRKGGGTLKIELMTERIDAQHPIRHMYPPQTHLKDGNYLKLRIMDSGEGMSPTTLSQIFDPFFTTKAPGMGTGLGLSVVASIIKSYGGAILVKSTLGGGSSFDLFFPRIEEITKNNLKRVQKTPKGHEHILFVDDEELIVDLGRFSLEKLGYHVTSFTNSSEALAAFKKDPEQFDLIITDMTMPCMTGDKLAAAFLSIRPKISIILCTGYNELITEESASRIGIKGFLMKPFSQAVLATTIRDILDQTLKSK